MKGFLVAFSLCYWNMSTLFILCILECYMCEWSCKRYACRFSSTSSEASKTYRSKDIIFTCAYLLSYDIWGSRNNSTIGDEGPQEHRNLESLKNHRPATHIIPDILMPKNYEMYFTYTSSILQNFTQKYHKEAEVWVATTKACMWSRLGKCRSVSTYGTCLYGRYAKLLRQMFELS